jgi:hypothetical protein
MLQLSNITAKRVAIDVRVTVCMSIRAGSPTRASNRVMAAASRPFTFVFQS